MDGKILRWFLEKEKLLSEDIINAFVFGESKIQKSPEEREQEADLLIKKGNITDIYKAIAKERVAKKEREKIALYIR